MYKTTYMYMYESTWTGDKIVYTPVFRDDNSHCPGSLLVIMTLDNSPFMKLIDGSRCKWFIYLNIYEGRSVCI